MLARRNIAALTSLAAITFATSLAWANGGNFPDAGGMDSGSGGSGGDASGFPDAGGMDSGMTGDASGFPDAGGDGGEPDGGYAVADGGTPGAILALPCGDGPDLQCMYAETLVYDEIQQLPIAFDWDTGWIPGGSPIQVRFYVKIPAFTHVEMNAGLIAKWPDPITLNAAGLRKTGYMNFDYGLEVGAKAKIAIKILGQSIGWQGDIPYLPQIDFHVTGQSGFDPWSFGDGTRATGFTPKLTLFELPITDLIIKIPGISGGIRLDLQGELQVTYATDKVVISPSDAPQLSDNGTTRHQWKNGAWAEYKVHPEGHVDYAGVIHLIPSFYVKILSFNLSIPIYDFAFDLDLGQQDWKFDDQLVHVPLPDIRPPTEPVNYGSLELGDEKTVAIKIPNIGEAMGRVEATSTSSAFKVLSSNKKISPGKEKEILVRFLPKKLGFTGGFINLTTNDPDLPFAQIKVQGEALEPSETEWEPPTKEPANPAGGSGGSGLKAGNNSTAAANDGGCGCSVPNSNAYASLAWGFASAAFVLMAYARRRSYSESFRNPQRYV